MKTIRVFMAICAFGTVLLAGCGSVRPLVEPGTPHTSVSDKEIKERVDKATGELGTASDSVDQYSNQ